MTHTHIPKSHFRKGGTGNYKRELTDNIIKDLNIRFSDYLSDWGYQLDNQQTLGTVEE